MCANTAPPHAPSSAGTRSGEARARRGSPPHTVPRCVFSTFQPRRPHRNRAGHEHESCLRGARSYGRPRPAARSFSR
jgi:hypothetical protein